MKDIALKLNLSISTVGRALGDDPRISKETKDIVRQAADELGYVANRAAQVMRGNQSHLIGLLVPDIQSTFYAMVAQNLSACFEGKGYHLALSITDDNPEKELAKVQELVSTRVAGIAIIPTASPKQKTLELFKKIPHVQILRYIPALGDWFGMDDERGIQDAVKHLVHLGHRRIAFVGDVVFPTGKVRYNAFCKSLTEAGIKVEKSFIQLGFPDREYGHKAVLNLMSQPVKPTAIINTAVQLTLGVAEQLTALNIKVPDDVSVIGYGDADWCPWWGPGLTTLKLPVENFSTNCGLWFVNSLEKKRHILNKTPHLSMSSIALLERGSTAAPPS